MRARFAKHIAILILVDACASAIGYYLFGYAFAFGDNANNADGSTSQNRFIGSRFFALSGLDHANYYLWVFQWSVSIFPSLLSHKRILISLSRRCQVTQR